MWRDWEEMKFDENLDLLCGYAFPSEFFNDDNEGVPLIRIRDILANSLETYYRGSYPKEYLVENGDILIGMDGDFNITTWSKGIALLNQRVLKVSEKKKSDVFARYIYHWLDVELPKINAAISGTTVKHLSTKDLAKLNPVFPEKEEQKAIAEVLDTVDEAIAATQAMLEKQDKIKDGLLQDLLTRGVDASGTLRPCAADAPNLYKPSPLGLIPKEWDVTALKEVTQKIQDGTHFSPSLGGGEYLYITSKNIRFGYLDLSNVDTLDAKQHKEIYRRCDVKKGDLLLTKDGANTGNAAINNLDEEFSLLSSVALLRFNIQKHSPDFFMYSILSEEGQKRIKDLMSGNAITRLTLEKINAFEALVPPTEEQYEISRRLKAFDEKYNADKNELTKLKKLKAGLMQDLLTGKKRVPSALKEAA